MTARQLPPYLRRHADRLRTDHSATVWVACGPGAWNWARDRDGTHHIVIVCPPGEDPTGYDWTRCAGHDPVLLHREGDADGAQVRALIESVLRDGAGSVLDDLSGDLYVVEGPGAHG